MSKCRRQQNIGMAETFWELSKRYYQSCAMFSVYIIYISEVRVEGILATAQLKCEGINIQGKIGLKHNFVSIIEISIMLQS